MDELETPSDSEQLDSGHEFEWEGRRRPKGGADRTHVGQGERMGWDGMLG